MDQFLQLRNNLKQTRDKLNSVLGQVNQELQSSEQLVWNISHQLSNQPIGGTITGMHNPQFASTNLGASNYGTTNFSSGNFVSGQYQPIQTTGINQYGGAQGNMVTRSQYHPGQYSAGQSTTGGFTGTSQFGANNNYYQSSVQKGGGVNQYGAGYSSGKRDEDVGNAYYQTSGGMTTAGTGGITSGGFGTRSQYNPEQIYGAQSNPGGLPSTSQYGASNNYYQSSVQKGGGANQYGAQYSSGTRDEDVGSAYYQSKQGF